jgi:hypothetical protein
MTKILQLFRASIPNELFIKICQSFGYRNGTECIFCKSDLERLETFRNMLLFKDELCQYYIPCKAKLYLANLTLTKCITIFRQVLRLNNMALVSFQRYIKHKKTTFYTIKSDNNEHDMHDQHAMKVNNNHMVVTFL